MQSVLCGWYIYLAVLSALMALSAGGKTWLGRLGWLAAFVGVILVATLYGLSFADMGAVTLGIKFVPLAAGLLALAFAPRQDTKLIGLLLAGASALPIYLHFTS